ncbi:hypothetical protein BUALT_Bualt14G0000400 [Buddleja alternifolia]|uniref:RNase H type-1 domain-containing protein n=1 Tax=Buddleja alternifolia TaxID=168488 RepID=A0AAV6WP40_9LAMI|nr:hypothetical protein BUALT_Bualt14G0000400 [Buddleja alternifolia]
MRWISAEGEDVLNAVRLDGGESVVDVLDGHVSTGEVHHSLDADHVVHSIGDVKGEIGGGSASAPGDVAKRRVVSHHSFHSIKEVIDAILGLGREELEGEDDPRRVIVRGGCLEDLVYHLHFMFVTAMCCVVCLVNRFEGALALPTERLRVNGNSEIEKSEKQPSLGCGLGKDGDNNCKRSRKRERGTTLHEQEQLFDLSIALVILALASGVGRVLKLVDKEIRDLLLEYGSTQLDIHIGRLDYVVELIQEQNENSIGFLGLPKVAFQISLGDIMIMEAEMLALREGLQLAWNQRFDNIVVETD